MCRQPGTKPLPFQLGGLLCTNPLTSEHDCGTPALWIESCSGVVALLYTIELSVATCFGTVQGTGQGLYHFRNKNRRFRFRIQVQAERSSALDEPEPEDAWQLEMAGTEHVATGIALCRLSFFWYPESSAIFTAPLRDPALRHLLGHGIQVQHWQQARRG